MADTTRCAVTDCERPHAAKGYCHFHYNRWKRHGDPLVARRILPRGATLADRLAALCDRSAGPGACWPWIGSISHRNSTKFLPYGTLKFEGRQRGAHVWAYVLAHGEPPTDKSFILHTCDNSICVNPAHLYAGTHQRNMDDKVERNRQSRLRGEMAPNRKLTDAQVYEIRAAQGEASSRVVGDRFEVSPSAVQHIWNRKRWAHLPDRTPEDDDA